MSGPKLHSIEWLRGRTTGGPAGGLAFLSSQKKQKAQMSHFLVLPLVAPSPGLGPTLPPSPLSRLSHLTLLQLPRAFLVCPLEST